MLPVPIHGMEASRAASEVIGLRQNLELELGAVVVHGEDDNPAAGAAQVPSARSVGFAVQIVPIGNLSTKPFGVVELLDAFPGPARRSAFFFHRVDERLCIQLGIGEYLSRVELVARSVSRFAHQQSLELAMSLLRSSHAWLPSIRPANSQRICANYWTFPTSCQEKYSSSIHYVRASISRVLARRACV